MGDTRKPFSMRVPEDLLDQMRTAAEQRGESVSEFVRNAVKERIQPVVPNYWLMYPVTSTGTASANTFSVTIGGQ